MMMANENVAFKDALKTIFTDSMPPITATLDRVRATVAFDEAMRILRDGNIQMGPAFTVVVVLNRMGMFGRGQYEPVYRGLEYDWFLDRRDDITRAFFDVIKNMDVDVNAPYGLANRRPLHVAVSTKNLVAVQALLDRGADVMLTTGDILPSTPLNDAVALRDDTMYIRPPSEVKDRRIPILAALLDAVPQQLRAKVYFDILIDLIVEGNALGVREVLRREVLVIDDEEDKRDRGIDVDKTGRARMTMFDEDMTPLEHAIVRDTIKMDIVYDLVMYGSSATTISKAKNRLLTRLTQGEVISDADRDAVFRLLDTGLREQELTAMFRKGMVHDNVAPQVTLHPDRLPNEERDKVFMGLFNIFTEEKDKLSDDRWVATPEGREKLMAMIVERPLYMKDVVFQRRTGEGQQRTWWFWLFVIIVLGALGALATIVGVVLMRSRHRSRHRLRKRKERRR